jgi:hypothetical protein
MTDVFICDAVRTRFGRYGGSLSGVRPDDLAAGPLRAPGAPGSAWRFGLQSLSKRLLTNRQDGI